MTGFKRNQHLLRISITNQRKRRTNWMLWIEPETCMVAALFQWNNMLEPCMGQPFQQQLITGRADSMRLQIPASQFTLLTNVGISRTKYLTTFVNILKCEAALNRHVQWSVVAEIPSGQKSMKASLICLFTKSRVSLYRFLMLRPWCSLELLPHFYIEEQKLIPTPMFVDNNARTLIEPLGQLYSDSQWYCPGLFWV